MRKDTARNEAKWFFYSHQCSTQLQLDLAFGVVETDPCQEKQISGLCIASAHWPPEHLFSICDFRVHHSEVWAHVDRAFICVTAATSA